MSVKDPLLEQVTPKTKWFVVLRPFGGENGNFVRGEVVDTTGWLHLNALASRRYISPLPHGAEVPNETTDADGVTRRMIVEASEEKPKAKARKSA